MSEPFAGMEPYYERLFRQIVQRREDNPPLGTGGDLDCLIAMVRWLWDRSEARVQPPAVPDAGMVERMEQAARILREWSGERQRHSGKWTTREQAAVECAIYLETAALRALTVQKRALSGETEER